VNGDLVCKTENGAMNIKNCEGNLNLKSENGAYKLIGCKGNLELKNENGAIRILDSELAKVTIINRNGSITMNLLPLKRGNSNLKMKMEKFISSYRKKFLTRSKQKTRWVDSTLV